MRTGRRKKCGAKSRGFSAMPEPELSLLFVRPLNQIGARYIVSGSVASILYGEPRLTDDIDFVIFLRDTDTIRLQEMFPAPEFYIAGRDELNAWAFRNARKMEYRGEPIVIAPPEYVIVRKLEYFREGRSEKHLRDIRAMLAVSGEQLDRAALADWVQRQGVDSEWRQVG